MENLTRDLERFRSQLTPERAAEFAHELGVSRTSLDALECGVASAADMRRLCVGFSEGGLPPDALAVPERDATGAIIGFCFRARDARKGAAKGSKRGLVYATRMERPRIVILPEGPSDGLAAISLGLSPVARPSNSTGGDMIASIPLRPDVELLVLADRDGPGIDGAHKLARKLATARKKPVRVATLPGGCKDLRAYLRSLGLDLEDRASCEAAGARLLAELEATASVVQPARLTVCYADVEAKSVEWALEPIAPRGTLSMLVGHPGKGKSAITVELAARLSRGDGMPGGPKPNGPVHTLFLSTENDRERTMRPRLDAAGAVVEFVHDSNSLDLFELRNMLDEQPSIGMVVIDPLSVYLGGVDSHRDADVRSFLAPLAELARERNIAVHCVAHLNKSNAGPAILAQGGSIGFIAAARVGWMVIEDPDDEARRFLVMLKNNLGPEVPGWAFRIVSDAPGGPPRIKWESERVTESANVLFARACSGGKQAARGVAIGEAIEFLRDQLCDGPRPAEEMSAGAEAFGISPATLKRAKAKLGVKVRKAGMRDGWVWTIPPGQAVAKAPTHTEEAQAAPSGTDEPLRPDALAGDGAGGFCDAENAG